LPAQHRALTESARHKSKKGEREHPTVGNLPAVRRAFQRAERLLRLSCLASLSAICAAEHPNSWLQMFEKFKFQNTSTKYQ